MQLDNERQLQLLRATLREIIRIDEAAKSDKLSVAFDDALEGRDAAEWRSIMRKARSLVAVKP